MSMFFAVLKWISLAIGIIATATALGDSSSAVQETVALLMGCMLLLMAIFFQLEQHRHLRDINKQKEIDSLKRFYINFNSPKEMDSTTS